MGKRKRTDKLLPWYRARNYKGNLTEAEKRQLDVFRTQPKHPAAQEDDLPEEVRDYIGLIELQLYDAKQDGAAGRALLWSGIGAVSLFLNYRGCFGVPTIWAYAAGALLLVVPWIWYRYEWHKHAEEFLPSGGTPNMTNEGFQQEWESNYVSRIRQAERDSKVDGK